jgi:hypothetical protein
MLTYKDKSLPHNLRLDAAKVAIRFEKPALTAIDANNTFEKPIYAISGEPMTIEDWVAKFTKGLNMLGIYETTIDTRPKADAHSQPANVRFRG